MLVNSHNTNTADMLKYVQFGAPCNNNLRHKINQTVSCRLFAKLVNAGKRNNVGFVSTHHHGLVNAVDCDSLTACLPSGSLKCQTTLSKLVLMQLLLNTSGNGK